MSKELIVSDSETNRWLNKAKDGDRSAQQKLLMQHHERLRRMVVAMLDSRLSARIDPSDVLQDAFAVAARRLPDYLATRPVPFYVWLRQIVKQLLIDVHRHHVRAQCRSVAKEDEFFFQVSDFSAMQLADQLISRDPSPSKGAGQREVALNIKNAMEEMSTPDREVLLMRFVEQLSVGEIAEILSISETTAKARVRRAIEKLGRVAFKRFGKDA